MTRNGGVRPDLQTRAASRNARHRGSVFVLVLLLTSLVLAAAVTFGSATGMERETSRNVIAELRSDLAAQSGLEFAQRRLLLEPSWAGTGPAGVELGDGVNFRVEVTGLTGSKEVRVSGTHGDAKMNLTATVEAGGGAATATCNKALVFLGERLLMSHAQILGDMLVADQLGVVDDWINFPGTGGAWTAGGPAQLREFRLSNVHLPNKTLFHYAAVDYGLRRGDQMRITGRVKMPAWDLSTYLLPDPDTLIIDDEIHIAHLHTTKTLVLVADVGAELHIENSHIDGGVVLWCERTWDLRGPVRNKLRIENCIIGPSTHTTTAVIAPAAEVTIENDQLAGFCFLGTVKQFANTHLNGQLIVVQELNLENARVVFNPPPGATTPPGILHAGQDSGVSLTAIREDFD